MVAGIPRFSGAAKFRCHGFQTGIFQNTSAPADHQKLFATKFADKLKQESRLFKLDRQPINDAV